MTPAEALALLWGVTVKEVLAFDVQRKYETRYPVALRDDELWCVWFCKPYGDKSPPPMNGREWTRYPTDELMENPNPSARVAHAIFSFWKMPA